MKKPNPVEILVGLLLLGKRDRRGAGALCDPVQNFESVIVRTTFLAALALAVVLLPIEDTFERGGEGV
jgi:hypothetical protein